MSTDATTTTGSDQPLEERVNNRSQRPSSEAFKTFMASSWAADTSELPSNDAVAPFAAARRAAVSARFPGERLVIPAGPRKVRSNDTDYRFRPHSGFAHLTGLGLDHEPDAVLIMEPTAEGAGDNGSNHQATLYFSPMAGRDSEEFYSSASTGEFWIGPRPTLPLLQARLGLKTADLSGLEVAITKNAGVVEFGGMRLRLLREVDMNCDALVDTSRINTGVDLEISDNLDGELTEALSEIRLVKDEWEIAELKKSVAATINGFHDVVRSLDRAVTHERGERVVEGAFFARAREEGNDLGYDTIAAAGNNATVLHWINNNGKVNEGDLLLLDAGVEAESLYTADITRTLPINGKYSEVQAKIYQAVLDASEAAFAVAKPGTKFRDLHTAALTVLAQNLDAWGLLPVSLEEALSPEGQQHRRWMPHGTSHHLGLDVHDCAQAKAELYLDGVLEEGMVFTIEPGLYFKNEDLAVPAEYRGIGVRIEDDILITKDGAVNLSAELPRTPEAVEAWMADLRKA
ncbi:aminopeptidase P family protein [Paeniglutamicibacter terrestris]|uniref:Xaa-Pro aminopeptidase n=1 Tax=Paeniglutamicibacter terrestris TaxID=2723403 RepID=A0ABX1G2E3_9MICC|nr:aminopeptidase P family protein [Paeniglutamicibacter terrestris]ASN39830.1 Xaa-Pro aminopeptidase [Arthrobacter sp. 7749]NKG20398.1 aminopeptidase P family protein [Paeniglutamicibacter terrestris]